MNKSTLVLSIAVAVLLVVVVVQSRKHNQDESKLAESKVTSLPASKDSLRSSTETSTPPSLNAGTLFSESSAIQLPPKADIAKSVPTKGPVDPREIFRAASKSVVLIKTFDASGSPLMIGSGFFVRNEAAESFTDKALNKGVNGAPKGSVPMDELGKLGGTHLALVTNAHVIAGASKITYENSRGQEREITNFLSLDIEGDLAVLASAEDSFTIIGEPLSLPELTLSSRAPEIGERIFVIGNPHGLTQTLSDGLVSAVRNVANEEVVQITAPISPGSSGGPVLNSNGEVVGVASFYIEGGENLNFAISSSKLSTLLSQCRLQPFSLALASAGTTQKIQDKIHGRDRLQIVGYENSASGVRNSIGVSIKNNESHAVGAVSFRITYFKDPTVALKARLAQLESDRRTISVDDVAALTAMDNRVREEESFFALLSRDPSSWNVNDVSDIPESYGVFRLNAKDMVSGTLPDYARNLSMNMVRDAVPDMKKQVQMDLSIAREQLDAARKTHGDREQRLKEVEGAIQEVKEQLNAPPPPTPVDYEDIVQSVGIASGLTRTVDLTLSHFRSGWICSYRVLDYEILATQ